MVVQISAKIDWLTMSKKVRPAGGETKLDHERLVNLMQYEASYIGVDVSEYEVVRGDGFYDVHLLFPLSFVRMSGSYNLETQGLRVVFSGQALPEGTFAQRVLSSAVMDDWKPTRIDVAIDIFSSDVTVEQWYFELFKQHGHNRQRSLDYKRRKNGDMVTFGSRESEKYLRIYDKAKEQALGNDWVRVELEAKGEVAVQIVPKLLASVTHTCMVHVQMLSLPLFWLAQYLESFAHGEVVEFEPKYSTKDGREKWLYEVVGKTLAKMRAKQEGEYIDFIRWVEEMSQGYDTERDGATLRDDWE